MSKTSALDRAIANLTQQIDALELARKHLQLQVVGKKPAKPRAVPSAKEAS